MIDWIKNINKEYPDFWKNYLSKFENKSNRFVILNIETTGFDPKVDKILSVGAVGIVDNNILVKDVFQMNLNLTNNTVIQDFTTYLGNATLIGHRINFDIEIINTALEKLECGKLKNEALDIEIMHQKSIVSSDSITIDEMLKYYQISKSNRFSTVEEAFSIALLFLKLKQRLNL